MTASTARRTFSIHTQPDDITCGPTSLHAVYAFYKDVISLDRVIDEVHCLENGGTLAVFLACHALRRGYRCSIYTYNLQVFDPSWFRNDGTDLRVKLSAQASIKSGKRFTAATNAYLDYLALGGRVYHEPLTRALLHRFLGSGTPVLTGLSATFLYSCPREREAGHNKSIYDDVRGVPSGHFVVLYDYDAGADTISVADPYRDNPSFNNSYYAISADTVINAIMLGIVTYDANLLIIQPPPKGARCA